MSTALPSTPPPWPRLTRCPICGRTLDVRTGVESGGSSGPHSWCKACYADWRWARDARRRTTDAATHHPQHHSPGGSS